MLLRFSIHTIFWSLLLLFSTTGIWLQPSTVLAAAYFEDGYLGLTQTELHQKLGMPQAVRDRKSALRVFTYYAITDWEKYFRKLVSPENGEDVYTFTRDGIDVRYSFSYTVDPNDESENRTLFVRLVDIEFSPAVPLAQIPCSGSGISPIRGSRGPLIPIEYLGTVVQGRCVTTSSFYCERGNQGQTGVDPGLSAILFARPAGPTHNQSAC